MTEPKAPDDAGDQQRGAGLTDKLWQELMGRFNRAIDELDVQAAAERVQALRAAHPEDDADALVERLIREKCIKAGAVGAATSGAAIIPGIGTLTSLTVGVAADIGATFKLQAELVLEIAAARGRALNEHEKRAAVLLITGMSAGANQALTRVGERASLKLAERYAQKWVTHALPIAGVAASASVNALTTYLVGKRADAYFQLGPQALSDWGALWQALSGVDVGALGAWLAEGARTSWGALRAGASGAAGALAGAGRATGGAIVAGAGAVVGAGKAAGEAVVDAGAAVVATTGAIASAAGAGVVSAASAAGGAVAGTAGAAASKVGEGIAGVKQRVGGLLGRDQPDDHEEPKEE